MTGNASPFYFATPVHFVFVDADCQYVKYLRQDALVGLLQQIRPCHVYDAAVAEACTSIIDFSSKLRHSTWHMYLL